MITELAPWASLVQRFGRLNRYGEQADARCVVLDADTTAPDACRPYEASDLAIAREHLAKLSDVGPASLGAIVHEEPRIVRPILRRRDLLDLFDTSPELLGSDLDVGRFVRDGEDLDVSVFYRAFDGAPSSKMPAPSRDELCSISLATARSLLERLAKEAKDRSDPELAAFVWNPLEEAFQKVRRVSPGQVLLLPVRAGGYDAMLGFTGEPKHVPEPVTSSGAELEANDADPLTSIGTWVTLTDHLGHVADAAEQLADQVSLSAAHAEAIVRAARFHDVGKAHPAFQAMLGGPDGEGSGSGPWAKSDGRRGRTVRRGFRHEWASALLLLQTESLPDTDLVAYLVAAHHGKVRLSVRALPEETAPDDDRIFARGVWDGDELPAIAMPDGTTLPASRLDASPVRLGRGSWLERTTRLRDDPSLGPFVLAYLEALVRIADARASRAEREGAGSDDPSMEMP